MTIRQSDLKLLWGRSGGRCALCRQQLSFDAEHSSASIPVGEQAHIVAREIDGPRGNSILTIEERDSYANLILLCPTDHSKIDRVTADFPVERLHQIKTGHELWVQSRLGGAHVAEEIAEQVYADLLDHFVELCAAEQWGQWASRAIYLEPEWEADLVDGIRRFVHKVLSTAWPKKHEELERAFITLATVLREEIATLLRHAEFKDNKFTGPKFYKQLTEQNEKRYKELFDEWREWPNKCQALVFEATRAANWVADCARKTINPGFLALSGKFRMIPSMFSDIPGDLWVPEYTSDERATLPDGLSARIENYRYLFPFPLADND